MSVRDSTEPGVPAWRLVVAFLTMLALAGALALVSRTHQEPSAPAPRAAGAVGGGQPAPPPEPPATGPALPALADVLPDVESALSAWGAFAATGEIDEVERYFWPAGPQHMQLAEEAPAVRAAAVGLPAYDFVLTEGTIEVVADDTVGVVGMVTVSRPGVETTRYSWRIEMRYDPESGLWRLWTVRTVDT